MTTIAVIFLALAIIAAWLPDSVRRRHLPIAAAGIAGLAGIAANGWQGLPLGDWTGALPLYAAFVVGSLIILRIVYAKVWMFRGVRGAWSVGEVRDALPDVAYLVGWAAVQQALLLGFLLPALGPAWAVAAFAALHLPNPFLCAVTLVGGFASVAIADTALSIPVAALAHATLSAAVSSFLPDRITGSMSIGTDYLAWRRAQ